MTMAKFTHLQQRRAHVAGAGGAGDFPDENGLEAVSGTAWVQTGESGTR